MRHRLQTLAAFIARGMAPGPAAGEMPREQNPVTEALVDSPYPPPLYCTIEVIPNRSKTKTR
jgi:hypothetical protein